MAPPAALAAAEVSEIDYMGLRCYSFTYTHAHNTQIACKITKKKSNKQVLGRKSIKYVYF